MRIKMKYIFIVILVLLVRNCAAQDHMQYCDIYDFRLVNLNGALIDLAEYKGKQILIVNVPEKRPYDLQYQDLEQLSLKYAGRLVVVGLLTPDFQKTPLSRNSSLSGGSYNVSFPLAATLDVKGDQVVPLLLWLTQKKYNAYADTEIGWDFLKFLINEEGRLVAVFDPRERANGKKVIAAIEH
jgi:glutathione peroxidase